MIVSHKHKFIFIKTYKTAGTSLEVLLSRSLGENDVSTPFGIEHPEHIVRNFKGVWQPTRELLHGNRSDRVSCIKDLIARRQFYNHIPARIVQYRLSKKVWKDYFKFCVERNPWDKTISLYYMQKANFTPEISLSEYIRQGHHCRNFQQYTDLNGRIIIDRVLKYESLNEELRDVLGMLGIPFSGSLEVRAKAHFRTERLGYMSELTKSEREIIAAAHADEISAHGY